MIETPQPDSPAQTTRRGRAFLVPLRTARTLLHTAWLEYEHDYAGYFAGAMVYYAFVSLVPLVLLLLAALGLLLRLSDFAAGVEQQVLYAVEINFGAELRTTIDGLLQRLQQGSVVATFVSLAGLLLTASLLFRHLRMTFRAIWKHAPPLASGSLLSAMRATFRERVIAFALVLAGGALLLGALAMIAALHWLGALLSDLPWVGRAIGWLLLLLSPVVVAPVTFGLLFKALPPVRLGWRDVWFAALLCGAAWLIGAEILALYVAFVGDRFSAYGALGAVLLLMLWMHVVSKVLFLGAELCKVVSGTSVVEAADKHAPIR